MTRGMITAGAYNLVPLIALLVFVCSNGVALAFVVQPKTNNNPVRLFGFDNDDLFADEPEMMDLTKNYLHSKYRELLNGRSSIDQDDAKHLLKQVLPPVSSDELDEEVQATLKELADSETIDEEQFVQAVAQNKYWKSAGDLVVKELVYFDALYAYYQTGQSLLSNDDYEELKESLTWEGSSVATMNKQEALFVTAVASARRGDPILDDQEYETLKKDLKASKSWVTARSPDALEKLGMDTFMGYLHRSL